MNIWSELKKPIVVLAPMYDVTDVAFRQIIAQCGKPDLFMTEFVSADGLVHPKSQKILIDLHLRFEKNEHPIVAQIFGANPETIKEAAQLVAELGFDGVDINMGCPYKTVVKDGQGAALIKTPKLAQEIVLAAKEGAGDLPVSVKTRTGFNKEDVKKWIGALVKTEPAAIIIHGRTRKQLSKIPADWNVIEKGARIAQKKGIVVLGNGDITSLSEAHQKAEQYHLDGVMIGRGVFGSPWFFNPSDEKKEVGELLALLHQHAQLYRQYFEGIKSPHAFKKHIKNYIHGFSGAAVIRQHLMDADTMEEIIRQIKDVKFS